MTRARSSTSAPEEFESVALEDESVGLRFRHVELGDVEISQVQAHPYLE